MFSNAVYNTVKLIPIVVILTEIQLGAGFISQFSLPARSGGHYGLSPGLSYVGNVGSINTVCLRSTAAISPQTQNLPSTQEKPKSNEIKTGKNKKRKPSTKSDNKSGSTNGKKNRVVASNKNAKSKSKTGTNDTKSSKTTKGNQSKPKKTGYKKRRPLKDLKLGSNIRGKVVEIKPYGAFIQTGYAIGDRGWALLHVSQIKKEKIDDISKVLKVGDKINPRVITIDYETQKVGVSLRTKRAPRTKLEEVEIGKDMDGKVRLITEYGAFIDVGCTTDALVHISRISMNKVGDIKSYLKVGQKVKVHPISVDLKKRSLAASMLPKENDEYLDRRSKYFNKKKQSQESNFLAES